MNTKFFDIFMSRVNNYRHDIELVDVINISIIKGKLSSVESDKCFDDVECEQHPTLIGLENCDRSRLQAIRHLKATIYTAFIKKLYEELVIYLNSLLRSAAIKGKRDGLGTERIVGDLNISMSVRQILEAGTWENIAREAADQIFRNIEREKSTALLIDKINKKLALNISDLTVKQALPFLEMRHVLVHANGIADKKYQKDYPDIPIDSNGKIQLNYSLILEARAAVWNLVKNIDKKVVRAGWISSEDLNKINQSMPSENIVVSVENDHSTDPHSNLAETF